MSSGFLSLGSNRAHGTGDRPSYEKLPLVSAKLFTADGRVSSIDRWRWCRLSFQAAVFSRLEKTMLYFLLIWLISALVFASVQGQIYPGSPFVLFPFRAYAVVTFLLGTFVMVPAALIFGCMAASSRMFWAFPSSVCINKDGFSVGKTGKYVRWKDVELMRIREYQYRGLRLTRVIEIFISSANYARARSRYLPGENFFHYYDAGEGKLAKDEFEGVCIRLPVDLFRFDEDLNKFLDLAAGSIPKEALHFEAQQSAGQIGGGGGYTALWLDELKSGQELGTRILPAGTTLRDGRYLVRKLLGTGGSSVVYDAVDKMPDGKGLNIDSESLPGHESAQSGGKADFSEEGERPVALKELLIQSGGTRTAKEQIFKSIFAEISLLRKLDHPNIVHCLDYFMAGGRIYVVLEAISGNNLREYVRENGPLPFEDLMNVAIQAGSILSYLHSLPVPLVHRDFTPDNLIWDGQKLSLIDFNVAEECQASGSQTIVGKQCYLAPEQWYGNFTPRGDLFQLGCTLFYISVGKDPEPLTQSDPQNRKDLPVSFCRLVMTLTASEPEKRYQSAQELITELRRVV